MKFFASGCLDVGEIKGFKRAVKLPDKYGDTYPFLKKAVRNNETDILNTFTDEGKI